MVFGITGGEAPLPLHQAAPVPARSPQRIDVRQELADSTNRGMERGVFGVPSFFVGDELYWGKDRMEFIEDELMRG